MSAEDRSSPEDRNTSFSPTSLPDSDIEAARVYRSYNATLEAYQAVDFDDLIRLPAILLETNAQVRQCGVFSDRPLAGLGLGARK